MPCVSNRQFPIDQPCELLVKASEFLDQAAAVRERIQIDATFLEKPVVIKSDRANEPLGSVGPFHELRCEDAVLLGMLLKLASDFTEVMRKPSVVGIEVRDDLATSFTQRTVACSANSYVRANVKSNASILREFLDHFDRSVLAAVVDDQQFPIRVGLLQHALDRGRHRGGSIPNGHHDRNQRAFLRRGKRLRALEMLGDPTQRLRASDQALLVLLRLLYVLLQKLLVLLKNLLVLLQDLFVSLSLQIERTNFLLHLPQFVLSGNPQSTQQGSARIAKGLRPGLKQRLHVWKLPLSWSSLGCGELHWRWIFGHDRPEPLADLISDHAEASCEVR